MSDFTSIQHPSEARSRLDKQLKWVDKGTLSISRERDSAGSGYRAERPAASIVRFCCLETSRKSSATAEVQRRSTEDTGRGGEGEVPNGSHMVNLRTFVHLDGSHKSH
ncbi:hypothetical protein J6590_059091 [Homalodisca vitripennis]|nr:hypothetical protein J6590_059091 [Homalodisca vitripennis]